MLGEFVIVRTVNAGVHCGYLESNIGDFAELREARRIWRWSGANTLNEISLHGAGENSRIAEPVQILRLPSGVIEIIPCTDKARANLQRSRWAQ